MKIKKIIIALLMVSMLLMLSSCDEIVIDENGVERQVLGRFIEVEHFNYKGSSQYLTYDKDTKIMYIIEHTTTGDAISPYYVLDENSNAVIGIYNK